MGDNYTADVVEALATVLEELQRDFSPSKTVFIGQFGRRCSLGPSADSSGAGV